MVTEEFDQWAVDAVADLNELNAAVNLKDFVVVVVVIEVEMVVRIWARVVVELDFWAAVVVVAVAIVDVVKWNYFELEIVVAVAADDDVVVEENLINHYFDTTKLALDFEVLHY